MTKCMLKFAAASTHRWILSFPGWRDIGRSIVFGSWKPHLAFCHCCRHLWHSHSYSGGGYVTASNKNSSPTVTMEGAAIILAVTATTRVTTDARWIVVWGTNRCPRPQEIHSSFVVEDTWSLDPLLGTLDVDWWSSYWRLKRPPFRCLARTQNTSGYFRGRLYLSWFKPPRCNTQRPLRCSCYP